MKNRFGFTLIEMLATIVILSIITTVAVVSVSKYIEKGRKESYVSTAHEYMTIASNMIAQQKLIVRNSDTVYYIHINNLDTQKKIIKSPYGAWADAYVVVTVDDGTNNFTYYWVSVDVKGYRIDLVEESELDSSRIVNSGNLTINTNTLIDGRSKIVIFDKDGKKITK